MSGPGHQAYNGQHMVPGGVPMGFSLSGSPLPPGMGAMGAMGAMGGQMNGQMGSQLGGMGGIGGTMGGMGGNLGGSLGGMASMGGGMGGSIAGPMGIGGSLGLANSGLGNGGLGSGSLGNGNIGAGQYQQPTRPLPSPQFYNQQLPQPTQYVSPNLIHTQLNHQPHASPLQQQLPPQRFQPSPQQAPMQFPVQQRSHSASAMGGANGVFSFTQPGSLPALTGLSGPISVPAPVSTPSPTPTPGHLGTPIQFMPQATHMPPQQHQARPQQQPSPGLQHQQRQPPPPRQSTPQQQQHRHQQQQQPRQPQQSPRYHMQQSLPSALPSTMSSAMPSAMPMSMFTDVSPVTQPQQLPKQQPPPQRQPPQPQRSFSQQQPQPQPQPMAQPVPQSSISHFSPLMQHVQPPYMQQRQPQQQLSQMLHSPQPQPLLHPYQLQQPQRPQLPHQTHQPHQSHQSHQSHQPLLPVQQPQPQPHPQAQLPQSSPTPVQQPPPPPPKAPKPPKPPKQQQAKKSISIPLSSPQPMNFMTPPPPPVPTGAAQSVRKASSATPSSMPSPHLQGSPRVSAKGGVQKPQKGPTIAKAAAAAARASVSPAAPAIKALPRKTSFGGAVAAGVGAGAGVGSSVLPKEKARDKAKAKAAAGKRSPADAAALLVCVADDCLAKAQAAAPALAKTRNEAALREYYKLLATGLGCLDTAVRTFKFPPRVEVKIKIRYASILSTETENLMDAETALQSAIATCEKHRLADLKIYVQFLFMKVLFRRKPKAALISIQTHIADCSDRRQTYWTYAFRFLKAFFYLQSGNPAQTHALENLHGITVLAEQRGDHAVYVLASLLQALALFRTAEPDVVERVQTCMAAASKYQLEASVHIPQLDVLWLLLDLACSLYHKEKALTDKLSALQARLEELKESPQWGALTSPGPATGTGTDACELLLPLREDAANSHTISEDTRDVLRPGASSNFLVLTSFSKVTAFVLGGLTLAPKQSSDRKSMDFWTEALKMLTQTKPANPVFLHEAVEESRWRAHTSAYVLVLMGLNAATHCEWAKVHGCLAQLAGPVAEARDGPLEALALYLKGVLRQGQGELNDALLIFEDPRLAIQQARSDSGGGGPASAAAAVAAAASSAANEGHVREEVALLAAMNRLLIMQLHRLRDEAQINLLVEQLSAACAGHANPEIKTAFSLVMAAITTDPPLSMLDVKQHIQQGLNGSTASSNAQCLNIALNTMRYRLFDNVVGEQALKSAKAGSTQAKKSGNILWMSVADGMLAETYEVLGQTAQAQAARQAGVQYANESWQRTQL